MSLISAGSISLGSKYNKMCCSTIDNPIIKFEITFKTIPNEEVAKALVRWQERCEKCIRISGSYIEDS